MKKSKDGGMNEINKYAHTHTHIQENKNLKKGNGGPQSPFTSSTLLKRVPLPVLCTEFP